MTLKQLQATPAGKINKIPTTYTKKTGSKYAAWMEMVLQHFADQNGLKLFKEVRFDKKRRFKFDFAIHSIQCAWEYEGLMAEKSRHTRAVGYSNDCTKYNMATLQGWKVFRYTVLNYSDLEKDLEHLQQHCKNKFR